MGDAVVAIPVTGQPQTPQSEPGDGTPRHNALAHFLVGPENHLIQPAVRRLLDQSASPYFPVVLYGPSGTGKSHLALGLAAAWKARCCGQIAAGARALPSAGCGTRNGPATKRVIYTTAIDFARELGDAIAAQAVEDLRSCYRRAMLVVVDDLDHVLDKPYVQEELIYTLDAIRRRRGQALITAHVAPAEMGELLPGLQSRLVAGLCLPLAPPGPAARHEILKRLAALREIELAEPAIRLLANALSGTVPELAGALAQLQVPAEYGRRAIDLAAVRDFLAQRSVDQPQIHDIAMAAARHFLLRLSDLRGPSRRRPVVTARDVAMFLARLLTGESLEGIGRFFGGRDHTTVMHGCRKTEERLKTDAAIRQAVGQLERKFKVAGSPRVL